MGTEGRGPAKPTEAEQERQAFETNTAEDVIAVDHSSDPGLLETFAAFQTKLSAVQEAAARVIAVEQRRPADKEGDEATSDDTTSVNTACATAAAKEQRRTLVLETQEFANKLTKPELKRMADLFAKHDRTVVSTSGAPLSMFDPDMWCK